MLWPIARGRISHSINQEFRDLVSALTAPLNRVEVIKEYESVLAAHFDSSEIKLFPFARTALYAVLESLELPDGSPIILPSITIKPMLDVVAHFNLSPIFVDLDLESGVWNPVQLEAAMAENPRVAFLTYLFGVVPNMDEITQILKEHNVTVIEDFSHSFNACYKDQKLGTFGDFGICSTSVTKSFDTYGGAVVIINNLGLLEPIEKFCATLTPTKRLNLLRKIAKNLILNIATNKLIFGILTFQVIKFNNRTQKTQVGKYTGDRNLNPINVLPDSWFQQFSSFQAQIGLREMKKQKAKAERRRNIAERYSAELKLKGPRGVETGYSTYWQYISIENNPIKFRDYLNKYGIDCATTSLTNLTKLKNYGVDLKLENTDTIYFSGVYLPCYPQLSEIQQNRIIATIRSYCE